MCADRRNRPPRGSRRAGGGPRSDGRAGAPGAGGDPTDTGVGARRTVPDGGRAGADAGGRGADRDTAGHGGADGSEGDGDGRDDRDPAAAFSSMGTLGVEEEFFVVDGEGRPVAGTDELVYGADPPPLLADRLDHELFKFVIETQTPTMAGPAEAPDRVRAVRRALVEHARESGFRVAAAGLHPAANWRDLDHAEKPRYRSQLDRIRYPQHRNTTAGLHVHVGVDDPDKATWIADALRWHLPVVLALSANSPYWEGYDTGLASARAKVFEALPNTGIPARFGDFESYRRFESRMLRTGAIEDRGELWYDVRPHTGHGTVEVRAPDAQHDPDRALALVEYVHALVVEYADRYEDGDSPGWLRREALDENKWRAIRYGHDASFLERGGEGTVGLGEVVDRECSRLGVEGIRRVYDADSGAARQRRVHETEGAAALRESLVLDPG